MATSVVRSRRIRQSAIEGLAWDLCRCDRSEIFAHVRRLAADLAMANPWRLCSSHDVQTELCRQGRDPSLLGSALGNLFRFRDWQPTPLRLRGGLEGRKTSERRVWRYVGPRCRAHAGGSRGFSLAIEWICG